MGRTSCEWGCSGTELFEGVWQEGLAERHCSFAVEPWLQGMRCGGVRSGARKEVAVINGIRGSYLCHVQEARE